MSMVRRQGAYLSTKVYDDINCIFRRWNAEDLSDRQLKPYVFKIKVLFECYYLDQGYVLLDDNHDCLKEFDKMLNRHFKNKIIVAADDPELSIFQALDHKNLIRLEIFSNISAERIAEEIFNWFKVWLVNSKLIDRIDIRSVELTINNKHTAMYVE